jgi:hypothetical protein
MNMQGLIIDAGWIYRVELHSMRLEMITEHIFRVVAGRKGVSQRCRKLKIEPCRLSNSQINWKNKRATVRSGILWRKVLVKIVGGGWRKVRTTEAIWCVRPNIEPPRCTCSVFIKRLISYNLLFYKNPAKLLYGHKAAITGCFKKPPR